MIKDFYSYIKEEESDIISYSFLTITNALYYVYFDPYQYALHVEDYPNLLKLGYGFGFERMSKPSNWVEDPLIFSTISQIVFDFIQDNGNEVVLLYHCDNSDQKQKGRDKIFEDWYRKSELNTEIFKKRISICHRNSEDQEITMFMGYLTSESNQSKSQIEEEFQFFAENLVDKH